MIKAVDAASDVVRAEKEKEKLKNTNYKNGNGVFNTKLKKDEYLDYNKQVKKLKTLTTEQWRNWSLTDPPGENHHFWLLDARIILPALKH